MNNINKQSSDKIIDKPSKKDLEKLVNPYQDYEGLKVPEVLENKIEELMSFFDFHGINYDKYNPDSIPKLDLDKKKAYPNFEQYVHVPGQHNTQKWLQAVNDVYYKEKNGVNRVLAIRQATSGWNLTETYDFLNWLRFYEEGAHLKYKFAQVWYENGAPGYFLHVKQDPPKPQEAVVSGRDIDFARETAEGELSLSEKKQIIEKQRQKIIGRLDSTEKLLRSTDGQLFAGKELESLMEAIYNLKKKIQLVNKISSSVRLYEDMIIREANVLNKRGFVKASEMLYSLAEDKIPSAAPPAPPQQGSGAAGGLPSTGPGMPQTPPESAPNDNSPVPEGISKFLENLDTGKITTKEDKHGVDDDLSVDDSLEVNDELLITEAQEKSTITPPTPTVQPKKELDDIKQQPLEITENELKEAPAEGTPPTKDFENMIDAAFANLSINDVVAKLEDLAKIFKTREVPRQLAIVDLMLDRIGLSSFFPSLSEAMNRALDGNQYISTRIDDILSKLRGAMKTNEIDLKGDDQKINPEVQKIRNTLQQNDDKEKQRKEIRKQKENIELESPLKESPDIEIEQDLAQPPLNSPSDGKKINSH